MIEMIPDLVRLCSQIRKLRMPWAFKIRTFLLSRIRFRSILFFQNDVRVEGMCPQRGHPCQKHPSTNTASRRFRKKKSGLPVILGWRVQPLMPVRTSAILNKTSVLLLLFAQLKYLKLGFHSSVETQQSCRGLYAIDSCLLEMGMEYR